MPYLSPVIVLIVGLAGAGWYAPVSEWLLVAFFLFVAAVGLYELLATLAHESGESEEG
jgi:uncharacterized membrane protein